MKKLYFILLTTVLCQVMYSQNSVAQLKFEDAEQAYTVQDYKKAIQKLEEAEKLQKKTTPKILYLKIAARNKQLQAKDNPSLEEISVIKTEINTYLKNYGSSDDKYKEVFEIGEQFKNIPVKSTDLKEAGKGNVEAGLKIAKVYLDLGNFKQALALYQNLEKKGSAMAACKMGFMHEYGKGTKVDPKTAMEFYKKAAAQNAPEGSLGMAYLYFSGKGTPKNKEKASELYAAYLPAVEKKAAAGNVDAIGTMAFLYFTGAGVSQDFTKAYEWTYKAALLGDGESMCAVGYCCQMGFGVKKNFEKSIEWFVKSAEQGYSQSMYYLGAAYFGGVGVEKNDLTAMDWFRKGSQIGNAKCLESRGLFYIQGIGTAADPAIGVQYLLRAADQGSRDALVLLGNMYRDGTGVAINYGTARGYYERAVEEADDIAALRHLGFLYYEFDGYGNSIDYTKAAECFSRAAAQGDGPSMKQLAMMYKKGRGVKKDKELAKEWSTRAETAAIKQ
ncbi:tetratricopeptide repeat protein [Flavobacterium sp. KACC 22758]|uniref:SEL1-like repeat protein n=1 Tax=Flavobacterium sp. KACC 22758 TaxID=3025667 RepID=UPI002366B006|nr:tetratricopeptide repeat protein [Flavobacterium sp. KACC 22758]WDF58168.1 tetratricopeptide repeat protein [Flavobacterium sp. KACC 22758]